MRDDKQRQGAPTIHLDIERDPEMSLITRTVKTTVPVRGGSDA